MRYVDENVVFIQSAVVLHGEGVPVHASPVCCAKFDKQARRQSCLVVSHSCLIYCRPLLRVIGQGVGEVPYDRQLGHNSILGGAPGAALMQHAEAGKDPLALVSGVAVLVPVVEIGTQLHHAIRRAHTRESVATTLAANHGQNITAKVDVDFVSPYPQRQKS